MKVHWEPAGVIVVPYQDQNQVFADLTSGRLDGTLLLAPAGQPFLQRPDGKDFSFVGQPVHDDKILGSGIAFETPVLCYFLARFGMINSRAMLKYWREATIVILFVSGFMTPGDVVATMIIFGVVLLILYFISAGVVWLVERASPRD